MPICQNILSLSDLQNQAKYAGLGRIQLNAIEYYRRATPKWCCSPTRADAAIVAIRRALKLAI
jgi:hypothetical protein